MGDRASALVVVDVCGGCQCDIELDENVFPCGLQRQEHGALDLTGVLQGKVGARGCIQGPVRCEDDPGGHRTVNTGKVCENPVVLLRSRTVVVFLKNVLIFKGQHNKTKTNSTKYAIKDR